MPRLGLIYGCLNDVFILHWGDATRIGYGLTVLYVLATGLFLRALLSRGDWLPRERLIWLICTLLLVLMTLNKQLDLQRTVIWAGRCLANKEGWIDQSFDVEMKYGHMVLLAVVALTIGLGWLCRTVLQANGPLFLGMVLLLGFITLQIARFDQLLGATGHLFPTYRLHRILEALALGVLIWAALVKRPLWHRDAKTP